MQVTISNKYSSSFNIDEHEKICIENSLLFLFMPFQNHPGFGLPA